MAFHPAAMSKKTALMGLRLVTKFRTDQAETKKETIAALWLYPSSTKSKHGSEILQAHCVG